MIDTEALRKKVIDLAIQGKLTQQLPEDGNVEDLCTQIQEEKNKLIKDGKIKKEKPLSPISDDEIPFEIPENWKWVRLGETSFIERGGSPRPIKSYITNSEDGINWIKIGDVEKGGKYIYKTNEKIIPEGEKKSRHVYPGDFLLTNSMSFGRPYISMVEGCIHDGWLLIRDLKGYSADYLYYLLSSAYMYGQFCNKASGATVDNLNIDKVNSALIPLPPKAEQIRIADTIANITSQIDIIDAFQQQYESDREILKGKIIDAGIRGKLTEQLPEDGNAEDLYAHIRNEKAKLIKEGKIKKEKPLPEISDDEIPFEIPSNWKWVRFGDIAAFYNGDRSKNYPNRSEYTDNGVAWINTGHILSSGYLDKKTMNYISEEKFESLSGGKIQLGDLVYCLRGATFGKVARVEPFEKGAVASSLMIIRVIESQIKEYIYWFLKSGKAIDELHKYDNGAAQPNLAANNVARYLIPIPPLKEMDRIVAKIEQSLSTISEIYEL